MKWAAVTKLGTASTHSIWRGSYTLKSCVQSEFFTSNESNSISTNVLDLTLSAFML